MRGDGGYRGGASLRDPRERGVAERLLRGCGHWKVSNWEQVQGGLLGSCRLEGRVVVRILEREFPCYFRVEQSEGVRPADGARGLWRGDLLLF